MTGPVPAVPPQAFDAAWAAWHSTEGFKARLTAALEAAAPHLEAAARERCAQFAEQEAAKVSDVGLANAFRNLAILLREQP